MSCPSPYAVECSLEMPAANEKLSWKEKSANQVAYHIRKCRQDEGKQGGVVPGGSGCIVNLKPLSGENVLATSKEQVYFIWKLGQSTEHIQL